MPLRCRSPEHVTMTNQNIGRLAMRVEGNLWVAYFALPDSMEGAIFLGSIQMRFVQADKQRKTAFMDLMREAVGDIFEEKIGERPTWPEGERRAPEPERAGPAQTFTSHEKRAARGGTRGIGLTANGSKALLMRLPEGEPPSSADLSA